MPVNLPPNLPALKPGWAWVKLGDVIEKIPTTNKKLKQKDYFEEGKYPVIDQGQKLIGGYSNNDELTLDCDLPVIVFGDHTKVKKFINFKFIPGADGIKVIKPKSCFDPKLFYYFLYCIQLPDKGYARHFQFLEKEDIPLPPLPEQKKIVAKIEELFSELDSGVANLRKAKEQIKTYRQSVLAHAFTGRLHQDSQDLQIDRIKESSKSSNLENPGSDILPDNWKWVKLGEVISDFKRGPFGSTIKKSFFIDKGFKVYEQKNAIYKDHNLGDYYISEDKYNELEGFAVKGGDYLVSCSGTIGRIYKLPSTTPRGIINQALLRMRINDRQINENFFVYLFESELFQRKIIVESRGSAMKNLAGVKELKQIEFVLPPLPQQSYIVEEIEKRFSVADNLEKAIDESLNRSNKLRQSILKKAFEGNLV